VSGPVVAVVGLGQMGSGMAHTLARAGHQVLGVDAGAGQAPEGVERVDLPVALTHADVALLSLPGSAEVEQVLLGPQGLLDLGLPPRLLLDTSTCDPASTQALAATVADRGHILADAPVSGGASGARAGSLTVFLGCPVEHLDRVRRVLAPLASQVNHIGDVGAGHTAKLVNNLLCGIHLVAAREALAIARSGGVDPNRLVEAINTGSGRSAVTEVNLPRWVLSGAFDSGFPTGLMARDVALAVKVAQSGDVQTPLAGVAADAWSAQRESAGADSDFNRMVTP
jgi:3-hydroxyisobutyrate dehydrogenase